ncbi:NLI interacting factor-like phosphatase family protein, putative [Babesia caballi]|uniref:Mitochondrial import inner membrane translocase subunit TIM50 n=1 Tax=Babesia caballi TaxID=5871 RepID=A0AAV4LUI0_BABCB|nr:NLI interacting factor-like phosphatase family protein, putative [Babesia caballi]
MIGEEYPASCVMAASSAAGNRHAMVSGDMESAYVDQAHNTSGSVSAEKASHVRDPNSTQGAFTSREEALNMAYEHTLDFSDSCDEAESLECGNLCDASTLTPTSESETIYSDEYSEASDESDEVSAKSADEPPVSPECMMGLLSRYIDCTPQLHNTSMRLLITRSAIGPSALIPSQVIRCNRSNFVSYAEVRDHLELWPLFKCLRPPPTGLEAATPTSEIPAPLKPSEMPKLLVVLDLDETLVHMHDRPSDHFDYLVNIVENDDLESSLALDRQQKSDIVGFTVHPTMQVSLRPGVVEFFKYLRSMSQHYTVALYTAGTRHYANAILHALDPDCEVISPTVRFYRNSCEVCATPQSLRGMSASTLGIGNHQRDETVPPFYLQKDLEVFGWPLSRVVFFDNSLLSFMKNPDNGVWIRPWRGAQPYIDDGYVHFSSEEPPSSPSIATMPGQDGLYEFGQVVRLLEELAAERDVRESLRRKFTLSDVIEAVLGTDNHPPHVEAMLAA